MSARRCPQCQSVASPRAKFCPECGSALPGAAGGDARRTMRLQEPAASVLPAPHYAETAQWPGAPQPVEQAYAAPAAPARRGVPWILAGLGLLILLATALVFMRGRQQDRQAATAPAAAEQSHPTEPPAGQAPLAGAASTPTRQPADQPAAPASRKLLLHDSFDSRPAQGGWPDQETQDGAFHYRDGSYEVAVHTERQILWTSTTESYGAVDLAIDVVLLSGPEPEPAAGLVLRQQQAGGFYAFQVRPNGTYAFRTSTGDGSWEGLIEWERSDAIRQGLGQTNRLRVVARSNSFELYINGTLVNTLQDTSYSAGTLGFGVSTFDQGGAVARFDEFELREP